jgi:hypothetical protein
LGLGPYLLIDLMLISMKIIIKVDRVNLLVPRNKLFMGVASFVLTSI